MNINDYTDVASQVKHYLSNVLSLAWLKTIFSFFGLGFAWVFNDERGFFPALIVVCLIVLDSCSGMLCAVKTGEGLSSTKAKRIAFKLILYSIAILTGRLVDKTLPMPMFAVVIEVFLALTEAQSIIENLGKAGMPIPAKLMKLFSVLKDKNVNEEKKDLD